MKVGHPVENALLLRPCKRWTSKGGFKILGKGSAGKKVVKQVSTTVFFCI